MHPQLSIIIISYNTKRLTLECLHSVFRETQNTTFEVIVLDNNSSDQSAQAIENEFGNKIQLITSEKNLGFAEGNNHAANDATGEYLLLLNPDTLILDGAIDKLVTCAKDNIKAGIWGGRTLFTDGTINPASCWMRQTIWSLVCQAIGFSSIFRKSVLFNPEGLGGWNRDGIREVDIVSGCFFLIQRNLWKCLNGFHPEFFMYGEEADLCLRAKHLGAQPIVFSQATIIHYGGASEKIQVDKLVRLINAKILLIKRHFPRYSIKLGVVLLACWPLSRYVAHFIACLFGQNSSENKGTWKSVWNRRKEWLT